jgi:RHS repeat-associated protein
LARWGETLIEEKATRPGMHFESPYRFNAKELDEETGLYYYGARYYNPMVSVWLGVDPKAYAFPHVTSYNFLLNNPIMMVDPGGDSTFSLTPNGSIVGLNGDRHFQQENGSVQTIPSGMAYVQNENEVEKDMLIGTDNETGNIISHFMNKGQISSRREMSISYRNNIESPPKTPIFRKPIFAGFD